MALQVNPNPAGSVPWLQAWLEAPHVVRWWRPGRPPAGARCWRIDLDGCAIGCAWDHDPLLDDAAWNAEEGVGPATRAIELLIGEPAAINRKHGREAIRVLANRLFADAAVDRLVAAPHPDNWACIIAFKRAGFRERGRRQFAFGPAMVLTAARTFWKG